MGRVIVPGHVFPTPVANGAINPVEAGPFYIGDITTFVEPLTNTFVNYTLDGHLFDTGVVGVTVSETSTQTVLTIHGCGQNTDSSLALLNGYAGASFAFAPLAQNLQNLINPLGAVTVVHH